jgi:demethylmenaquinone methyltransferase/2-methoxy-6-polyprenyl-1,4-benzoquinol methylase
MSTIVLMKAFESVPGRYDLGMRLITFGEIVKLRRQISEAILPNSKVLDIGCGTGELLSMLARRGARVAAIDKSPEMVKMTRERATTEGIGDDVSVSQNTAMEIDRLFQDAEFDAVVLSLVMSELTTDERSWVLNQCARILKPGGVLLIADEFWPRSFVKKAAFSILRFPLHLITYLYTQIKGLVTTNIWWKIYYVIVELPLMLLSFFVSEPLTAPLASPGKFLPTTLKVTKASEFWGGAVRLLKIRKEELDLRKDDQT